MTADDDTPANRSGILTEAEMPILTKDQIELHVREGTSKFIGGDLARTCLSLFQQLAEAQAAQAELRAERDEAKRLMEMRHREMLAADKLMRKYQREAEADRVVAAALRARLAEGRVKALTEAAIDLRNLHEDWKAATRATPFVPEAVEVTYALFVSELIEQYENGCLATRPPCLT